MCIATHTWLLYLFMNVLSIDFYNLLIQFSWFYKISFRYLESASCHAGSLSKPFSESFSTWVIILSWLKSVCFLNSQVSAMDTTNRTQRRRLRMEVMIFCVLVIRILRFCFSTILFLFVYNTRSVSEFVVNTTILYHRIIVKSTNVKKFLKCFFGSKVVLRNFS